MGLQSQVATRCDDRLLGVCGRHKRKRGETASMIQACWYSGMRCTSEIARAVGVTPSCVTAHKRRLGLPMIYLNPDLRRKS
jgi:hypothetical protein